MRPALAWLSMAASTTAVACSSGDVTPGTNGNGGSAGDAGMGPDASTGDGSSGSAGAAGTAGTAGMAGASGGGGAPIECDNDPPAPTTIDPLSAQELIVAGDPGALLGHFDPSPVYPAGAMAGAMTYSAVPAQDAVFTRIAVSSDAGGTWSYVADVNAPHQVTVTTAGAASVCPSGCTGSLIHEVSSLLFDPDDSDASRRWKVFAHSYVVLPGDDLRRELGYIGLFTAPDPAGPWVDEGKAIGWQSDSEFSSKGAATVATDFAQLANCAALTEPGALFVQGGIIELALGCAYVDAGTVKIRIVMMRSFDNAQSFSYTASPIDGDDALCLGGELPRFNAPHQFLSGGQRYLLATPAAKIDDDLVDGYRGCHVFEVAASGAIQQDMAGYPISLRELDTPTTRFNGACAYAEGASNMGYLMSILRRDDPPRVFRIYQTGIAAP